MLVYLWSQFIIVHTAEFALTGLLLKTTGSETVPGVSERLGCTALPPHNSATILKLIFGLLLFNAIVLALLMCWGHKRFSCAHVSILVSIFFRDGIGYFLVIATMINIIANARITPSNFILAELSDHRESSNLFWHVDSFFICEKSEERLKPMSSVTPVQR
ncbi:hypothetical protein FA15DRAFT_658348 [Coprinopsis marcescibilis]|uniref:Uncharacterized protein n=1 Tax=Coprinopsis marcescibilis TaxID=230819 RepID=A0A5C3KZP8_COPMA|nr:hypothetical protein FA15DRAFT_658348 [Coprinopsis marcescibilis]